MQFSDIKFGTRGLFIPAKGSSDEILVDTKLGGIPAVVTRIYPGNQGYVCVLCEIDGGVINRNPAVEGYGIEGDGWFTPTDPVKEAVNVLVQACHGAAKQAGWWIDTKTGEPVTNNPMCFSQKLMLIVTEVAESMEGDRKSLMDDKLPHRPMREVELADALIRTCDTSGGFNMDLAGAVVEKLAYNAHRPDHKLANRIAEGGKSY